MKTKILAATLATVASVGPASGVELAADGVGQGLIYPYYTVRKGSDGNAWNTYLSVVNTSADAKAVRVHVREGRNGRSVLDFNLYLSPNDAWVAAMVPASADPDAGVRIIGPDNSCTDPVAESSGLTLATTAFSGPFDDGYGTGLDRTREGYVEVIEMATLTGNTAISVTQQASGAPANCAAVRAPRLIPDGDVKPPSGGLSGTLTVINVNSGMDIGMNAEALANLSQKAFLRGPSDPYPDFDAAEIDPVTVIHADGKHYRLLWPRAVDAVSAALTRQEVHNEYVLDAITQSSSAWILTFPTRRFYPANAAPFDGTGGCVMIPFTPYDRESRPQIFAATPSMCYAASDLDWSTASLFGSANNFAITQPIAPAGWARGVLDRTGDGSARRSLRSLPTSTGWDLATGAVRTSAFDVHGLPVAGFAARSFRNGTLQCASGTTTTACQGNYGGNFMHGYKRSITPAS